MIYLNLIILSSKYFKFALGIGWVIYVFLSYDIFFWNDKPSVKKIFIAWTVAAFVTKDSLETFSDYLPYSSNQFICHVFQDNVCHDLRIEIIQANRTNLLSILNSKLFQHIVLKKNEINDLLVEQFLSV